MRKADPRSWILDERREERGSGNCRLLTEKGRPHRSEDATFFVLPPAYSFFIAIAIATAILSELSELYARSSSKGLILSVIHLQISVLP
jgi:hypothetical protein